MLDSGDILHLIYDNARHSAGVIYGLVVFVNGRGSDVALLLIDCLFITHTLVLEPRCKGLLMAIPFHMT